MEKTELKYSVQAMKFECSAAVARTIGPEILKVGATTGADVAKTAARITDDLWVHYKMDETIATEEGRQQDERGDDIRNMVAAEKKAKAEGADQ